jgi:hypothetical protein
MDALAKGLMDQLGGAALSQIGARVGADEKTTGSALSSVMPILVSALAANASKPAGARSLHRALEEDHDGAILGDLEGFLSNPAQANGSGILRHTFGAKKPAVERGLAERTGLKTDQVGQLLEIAAPLVMGALGKQQRANGLDASGLSSILASERAADEQDSPDLLGMLNTVLDADKDGSAVDEVVEFVGKLFGKR